MFERFTARARRAIVLAQEEARLLGHDFIGTEHVLLGLLHEGEGVAGVVLKEMGFTLDGMRDEVRLLIGPTVDDPDKGKLPFTPRSKKVLELSLREALSLKHNYIGTEHLLLAILREGEGVGAQILVKHGGTIGGVRARVIERLEGYGKAGIPAIPPMPSPRRAGHTPAVDAIIPKAEELAMGDPTGSHHLLLSIIDEPDSLAARALTSFGITREAVTERLEAIGTEGTTDHVPEPDPFTVHAFEGGLTIRIDDEELAEKVRSGELTVSFKPTT